MKQINFNKFSKKYLSQFLWEVVRAVIIVGLCYVILYPFFIKIVNALKDSVDFLDPTVRFIPKHMTFDNIRRAMEKMEYWKTLMNTTSVAVSIALITTMISALVGYGFARFQFRGKNIMFFAVIFTLIVPPQTVIIPLFLRFHFFFGFLNLLGTPFPVLILALTGLSLKNGLYIFMFRQFFKNMPKELEEASYLDGCNAFNTYNRIMLPSAKTMLITVFLLALSWQWTDLVYNPLFFQDVKVFAKVINLVASGESPGMGANMTNIAALLSVVPLAIIYILAQKFFVQSVERSGMEG